MNNTLDSLIQYCHDCINNNIKSCRKHKQACQRFLKDYNTSLNSDSDYIFIMERVEKVIRWSSLFKHTKGVLAGKPIQLHMSQIFIIANVYGFYIRKTGYRRFKKFYLQVARKNAKSQLLAVILSWLAVAVGTIFSPTNNVNILIVRIVVVDCFLIISPFENIYKVVNKFLY